MTDASRLMKVFSGLDRAYGQFTNNRARTVREPLKLEHYEKHLTGKAGLGVVPIRDNNTCRFAAIDIDVDNIDHVELEKKVTLKKAPFIVCRSKSGGAHLYTFYSEPGIVASIVRQNMSSWAAILGLGNSEVFPKQNSLNKKTQDVGNWINLPYFNVSDTKRYAVINGKVATFAEFVDAAEALAATAMVVGTSSDSRAEPPCLSWCMENKITTNHRNKVLFNFGVYLKRAHPEDWMERLEAINRSQCERPLSAREMLKITKSVDSKDYNYSCEDEVLKDHCNKLRCQQIKYGVGRLEVQMAEMLIGSITKIATDPPYWMVEMNGVMVSFTSEQLLDPMHVQRRWMEVHTDIPATIKRPDWLEIIRERLKDVETKSAPEDATKTGLLGDLFFEYMKYATNSKDRKTMVIRGLPVKMEMDGKNVTAFRSQDFLAFLKRKKYGFVTNPELWMALRTTGCRHKKIKVGASAIQVWYVENDTTDTPMIEQVKDDF